MLRNVLGPNTDCFLLIWFHHMLKIAYFSLCPCFSLPFPPGILCSSISISWCLLFFSCNQTHRFISVALRHYLNQFPSPFPSWRAAVRVGTLHLGTHLYTYAQTLSISFTHTVTKAHRQAHIRCTQVQTHSYRWFTTSLFSNVLLASSLQHPFVTADRSWQQHLSILPLSSLCQPTLCFPQLWPPPPRARSVSKLQRKKWGSYKNGCYIDAGPCLQVALGFDASVQSQHGALDWAANQLASHLWSVLSRRACDA